MFILFTQSVKSQCWQKLGEGQDSSQFIHAIDQEGNLFLLDYCGANPPAPVLQFQGVTDWQRVFTGSSITLTIKTDSSLWGWGANWFNELFVSGNQSNPIQLGSAKWIDIAFGNGVQCGIKADGSLWRWGANIPVMTQIGIDNDWKDIAINSGWVNWNNSILFGIKNDNSLWYYDFSNPNPLWIQLGIGQQWNYIETALIYETFLFAINNNGDLYHWDNPQNPPVIIGTGPWKEVSSHNNSNLNFGLKVDGSTWFWETQSVPNLLSNAPIISEIEFNNCGALGLASNTLQYFAQDWSNNTLFLPNQIGSPCCNSFGAQSLIVCDSVVWNGQLLDTSGIYTAQLTNMNGCDSTVSLMLTINNSPENPVVNIQNINELTTQIQPSVSYQWLNCSNFTPLINDTINSLTALNGGEYAVAVFNGCGTDTSECIFVSNEDLQEYINAFIYLSPNPTTGEFKMNVPEEFIGSNFQILNEMGKCIYSDFIQSTSDSFSISNNQKAIYFLYIDNCPIVLKIVKN